MASSCSRTSASSCDGVAGRASASDQPAPSGRPEADPMTTASPSISTMACRTPLQVSASSARCSAHPLASTAGSKPPRIDHGSNQPRVSCRACSHRSTTSEGSPCNCCVRPVVGRPAGRSRRWASCRADTAVRAARPSAGRSRPASRRSSVTNLPSTSSRWTRRALPFGVGVGSGPVAEELCRRPAVVTFTGSPGNGRPGGSAVHRACTGAAERWLSHRRRPPEPSSSAGTLPSSPTLAAGSCRATRMACCGGDATDRYDTAPSGSQPTLMQHRGDRHPTSSRSYPCPP